MADLGVTKTHSRPHVSNDNPFSEAQFTPALAGGAREILKYRPDYPNRFDCQSDARAWTTEFFRWYNYEHHHSGIGLLPRQMFTLGEPRPCWTSVNKCRKSLMKRTPSDL
jgi:putative transposase